MESEDKKSVALFLHAGAEGRQYLGIKIFCDFWGVNCFHSIFISTVFNQILIIWRFSNL